ncbi:LRP1B [Cordylochernes scorpioides]|uniref:LRP1B n=1 Tax=Cordylochernes scorpioides TaxID=51811 RepID=A0ABY6KZC5_9ARAC|nr:LRP1B [Cordylochernes scorpioides]
MVQAMIIKVTGLVEPRGVAVNWLSHQVYWVDAGVDTISVASLDGKQRRTLISSGLDQPHAIVVDPSGGMIYWTDWGREPKLERAKLDGKDRHTFIGDRILWPTGLAIDHPARMLYWADLKGSRVEATSLEFPHQRHMIHSFERGDKPVKVDVFEDDLFVTTFHQHELLRINKFGNGNVTVLAEGMRKASDLVLIQEYKQTKNCKLVLPVCCISPSHPRNAVTNPCAVTAVCGEGAICLPTTPASCICPDGLVETKTDDGKQVACTARPPRPSSLPEKGSHDNHAQCKLNCLNKGICMLSADKKPYCRLYMLPPRCPHQFEGEKCHIYRCTNYCENHGRCYFVEHGDNPNPPMRCNCPPQWTGERCSTPLRLCDKYCHNNGVCAVRYGVPECVCPTGFQGPRCQECTDLKCQNGGVCTKGEKQQNSTCLCPRGYSGPDCQESACANICRRGNCTISAKNIHVPVCNCPHGYAGRNCELDLCPHYCAHGGTCHRVGPTGKMVCSCPEGYKGSRCDRSLCGCQNGATCIVSRTGYTCRCPTGFTGSHCETFVATNCADMACLHGGTCQVVKGVPTCKCPVHWLGQFCEAAAQSWNPCVGFCFHGGSCIMPQLPHKMPKCLCPRGFIGNRCQESTGCHNFCHNHATCYPSLNSDVLPSCICPDGFVGLRCQSNIAFSPPLAADQSELMAGWITALIIPLTVAGVLLILVLVGILLYCRKKSNIKIHFLPPNMTASLQPLDSGIIKSFKAQYRKLQLQKMVELVDAHLPSELRLDYAVRYCIIRFTSTAAVEPLKYGNLLDRIRDIFAITPDNLMTEREFQLVDDSQEAEMKLTDDNFLVSTVTAKEELGEDDDSTVTQRLPSLREARTAAETVLLFLEHSKRATSDDVNLSADLSRPFMHVRMQENANVEISNPMYLREEYDDAGANGGEGAVHSGMSATDPLAEKDLMITLIGRRPDGGGLLIFLIGRWELRLLSNQLAGHRTGVGGEGQISPLNFTNPVYDSIYAGGPGEEKKSLLQGEPSVHIEGNIPPASHPLA